MQWLSDEIEEISGYPASDFIDSAVRTFASVIHPDDREQVERSVMDAVDAGRPFTLEYRIRRRDGDERWVLERGQAQAVRRRPALARRSDLRHHRAPRRRAGAARARDRRGAAGRGPRLARAHPRGGRPRAARDRAQPARRRPAAVRLGRAAAAGLAGRRTATSRGRARRARRACSASCEPGSPSCATSRTASIPRSSATAGSPTRCPASPTAPPCRSSSSRPARRTAPDRRRGRRLLHRLRGAHERRQVRPRDPRVGQRRAARRPARRRGRRRRRRRRGRRTPAPVSRASATGSRPSTERSRCESRPGRRHGPTRAASHRHALSLYYQLSVKIPPVPVG